GLRPQTPAVELGDAARDRQPEPGAFDLLLEIAMSAEEALEHPRQVLGRNAGAIVLDHRDPVLALHRGAHPHVAADRSELDRVRDQVDEQPAQEVRIGLRLEIGLGVDGDLDLTRARDRLEALGHVTRESRQVRAGEPQRTLASLETREIEDVADEAREAVALLADDAEETLA